jgi:hypothetical protein
MALDKLIDSARLDGALSATATAILSKTGGSTPLTWDMDEGFADVIEDIPTGGGGDSSKDFIEQHNWITSFTDSTISVIGAGAFAYCYSLTEVSIPSCTSIGSYAF